MRFNSRRTNLDVLPGVTGTARVARRASQLLPRLRPGDIAVIDHHDLDRETALRLLNRGVGAVVNAAPMVSGRYANLGPEVLAEAGVPMLDSVGPGGWAAVKDGQPVRLHEGVLYADDHAVAQGRAVTVGDVRAEMDQARSGLAVQLDTLTHNASEFLRREQDLLLDGRGLPELTTALAGRAALVVASFEHDQLVPLRRFVRELDPVIIAVGSAADDLMDFGWAADVVIGAAGEPATIPSADVLRAATDVVLLTTRGAGTTEVETIEGIERLQISPLVVETSATPEDLALLIADKHDVVPLVGVGLNARLEDFLDRRQAGLASTFATRLKVGSRLVDATAVPSLHTSGATTGQVVALLLAGIAAVVVAVAVTPAGQEMFDAIGDQLGSLL
jgi:uncharacterized membrane-anchored protein